MKLLIVVTLLLSMGVAAAEQGQDFPSEKISEGQRVLVRDNSSDLGNSTYRFATVVRSSSEDSNLVDSSTGSKYLSVRIDGVPNIKIVKEANVARTFNLNDDSYRIGDFIDLGNKDKIDTHLASVEIVGIHSNGDLVVRNGFSRGEQYVFKLALKDVPLPKKFYSENTAPKPGDQIIINYDLLSFNVALSNKLGENNKPASTLKDSRLQIATVVATAEQDRNLIKSDGTRYLRVTTKSSNQSPLVKESDIARMKNFIPSTASKASPDKFIFGEDVLVVDPRKSGMNSTVLGEIAGFFQNGDVVVRLGVEYFRFQTNSVFVRFGDMPSSTVKIGEVHRIEIERTASIPQVLPGQIPLGQQMVDKNIDLYTGRRGESVSRAYSTIQVMEARIAEAIDVRVIGISHDGRLMVEKVKDKNKLIISPNQFSCRAVFM